MKNTLFKAIMLFAVILSLGACSRNFDINKEGGQRIVVEISEKDLIKAFSLDSQDSVFMQAMKLADQKQQSENGSEYITLFGLAFEEVDPNANLAPIFLYEFRDKGININSKNDEVLQALKDECNHVFTHWYDIISTRLDRYCEEGSTRLHKIKYNILRTEMPGRIIIELPNDEEIDLSRVRKLIQSKGSLEFWETYNLDDIKSCFIEANTALAEANGLNSSDEPKEDEELDETIQLQQRNPLFAKLMITDNHTARVGMAQIKDTAAINQMLAETKNLLPRDLKLAWTVKPEVYDGQNGEKTEVLDLVALKMSREGRCALSGEVISEVNFEYDQFGNTGVSMQMYPDGVGAWKRITSNNIGKQIAIVLDDYVYRYPMVNAEIPNGRSSISGGGMTVEEAKDLVNVIKAGRLPASVRIIEDTQVMPK